MAQLVMVVQILIAQRNPEHALGNQRLHPMLDQISTAAIGKAARKAIQQADRPIGRPQQQSAGISRNRTTIKSGDNITRFYASKSK
jgi:hypothetical protein